ncbi:metallopeptidase [Calothrix sp. NIES-4101]|nr:metallopeptidase [Calothrix sp. NIES-4101]
MRKIQKTLRKCLKILDLKPKILFACCLQDLFVFLGIIFFTGLLVILINLQSFAVYKDISQDTSHSLPYSFNIFNIAIANPINNASTNHKVHISHQVNKINLPTAKTHPLPEILQQWEDKSNSGDYFDQVQETRVGYLVWSNFPVKIYIEAPTNINQNQAEIWVKTVSRTVEEWNTYLPLQLVNTGELADIKIIRKAPPLQGNPPRARSAQTTYDIYTKKNILSHRFTILLSPTQTGEYLIAASRHELGHALGIWGHSPLVSDVLYFSQVRKPPLISTRDVNTLKKVYKQPTKLGWQVE